MNKYLTKIAASYKVQLGEDGQELNLNHHETNENNWNLYNE